MFRMDEQPPYLVGLRLQGRRTVVVGGGAVAQRRVPALIAAGARVAVVSPVLTPALEGMTAELTWIPRAFEPADLDGAWYAVAATDDRSVNEVVVAAADERRIFCARADDAASGSAWTPATGSAAGVSVAVVASSLAERDPRRAAALRDRVVEELRDGRLDVRRHRTQQPGVVLVGGGPGDPDLITVAGRKALMEADVVVADRLAPREVLGDLPADVEVVDVAKLPRGRAAAQEEINRIIIERARAGQRVARFKGGDSFVFGRGFEEVLACREAGVPVSVIPGLSSSVAVPGVAGIPVTHRGVAHEFTVVSGHLPPGHEDSLVDWEALGRLSGTLVLLMAVQNAPAIATALLAGGRPADTPVAIVCEGTMPAAREVVGTLGSLGSIIAAGEVRPPAIIVIGPVVGVARG